MHNQVFYVTRDGSHGTASELPQDAIPISENQYMLISENPNLIDVRVHGSVVRITASLISYKGAAIESIRKAVNQHTPSDAHLNHLLRAVVCEQGCFDLYTTRLLDCAQTKEQLQRLNAKLNGCLHLQYQYTAEVHAAIAVSDVDIILDKFERALQDIV